MADLVQALGTRMRRRCVPHLLPTFGVTRCVRRSNMRASRLELETIPPIGTECVPTGKWTFTTATFPAMSSTSRFAGRCP